jgi:biopolymer transport protein ExbB
MAFAAAPGVFHYLGSGDAVTRAVAALLAAMSAASWICLFFKGWMLVRARRQATPAIAAFWRADTLTDAVTALAAIDREGVFQPLAHAALAASGAVTPGAMLERVDAGERFMRALRTALTVSRRRLDAGHVLLASIGSTAPFVGLLGTVWGIYHTLDGISGAGQATLDALAGPVGEALIMTSLGLVVAIPAVLGYNWLGRLSRQLAEDLDGFAHDLHAYLMAGSRR